MADLLQACREAVAAIEALIAEKPGMAGKVAGSTTLGNLRVELKAALANHSGVAPTEAPSLLQQVLEALELSQPLTGNEAKWSAAVNAIYAHTAQRDEHPAAAALRWAGFSPEDNHALGDGRQPPFGRGTWQHAVDDQLVGFGRTSQEFSSPHEAVRWLLEQTIEAARTAGVKGPDHG